MEMILAVYAWIGLAVAIIGWGIDNGHPDYAKYDSSVGDRVIRLFLMILICGFVWPLVLIKLMSGKKLFD
jgi:hypothetical protein